MATEKDLPGASHTWQRFKLGFLQASLRQAGYKTEELDTLETAQWTRRAQTWIYFTFVDRADRADRFD